MRIQHELRQCAMQARDAAFHDREARTGDLGRHIEIQAERSADIDVVADFKIKSTRRTDFAQFDIAGFVRTDRHRFMRQVGDSQHEFADLRLDHIEARRRCFQLIADTGHFRHDCGGVFALAFQGADLLGQRIALVLQIFGAGLDLFALRFQCIEGGDVELELATGQASRNAVDVFTKKLNIYHGKKLKDELSSDCTKAQANSNVAGKIHPG
ncbi:hypothetical protein D3C81_1505390 [compost metagenome]